MKINKFIYVAVVGALFASCQSVETPMFSDEDAFVAFDSKTTNIDENAGKEIQIPISLVASKALDVTVNFEIDTTAYAGKNAAKEGVNYRLKNTSKTLTYTSGGEMVQYIVIEPIDNGTYDGDVCFDIKLVSPSGCNLGANYTTSVTITDDDHPLAAAGILGSYTAKGASPFQGEEGVTYTWNCEIQKDADYVNRVWFTQIVPDALTGTASYKAVMGEVSDDFTRITIKAPQDLGTLNNGAYTLQFELGSGSSVDAQVSNGTISINAVLLGRAYEGTSSVGYISGAQAVTLTKVE